PARAMARQLTALREQARRLRARRRAVAGGGGLAFAFATHFADVAADGFGLVVGNPPWVRPHRVPAPVRVALRARFTAARHAAWTEGAEAAGAGAGFAAQADLAALFVERAASLLRPGGALALLVPAKLWRALAGGGVRRLLACETRLHRLEDWTASPPGFDAAVYPSLVVATRPCPEHATAACVEVVDHAPSGRRRWAIPSVALPLSSDPASPWPLVPPEVRAAFERLRDAGPPLVQLLGRPELGVKTGCNAAFVVTTGEDDDPCPVTSGDGRRGLVERALLRPALRGETVRAWCAHAGAERLVWTHDDVGARTRLPPHAHRWLLHWRPRLIGRADARGRAAWWSLFRTDAADARRTRVVWGDFGRRPRALVLPAGDPTVPLNSCYVLPCDDPRDAHALAALLNGPLAAAWLDVVAEPARGGWRRYLAWTVAWLPLPRAWPAARDELAELALRASAGAPPADAELLETALRAYGVEGSTMAPLLAWGAR
ncbi:MAG TPA: hypothetical protein VFY16_08290, partial [Gemmatimonadaceae bacterium]|nr:hypothetical protein [Gemmatimonadaceae bacterium]